MNGFKMEQVMGDGVVDPIRWLSIPSEVIPFIFQVEGPAIDIFVLENLKKGMSVANIYICTNNQTKLDVSKANRFESKQVFQFHWRI